VPWEIVPVSMIELTASADQLIPNGRDGALYMAEVKRTLENPVMLMVWGARGLNDAQRLALLQDVLEAGERNPRIMTETLHL
jgi:hypothetical protein